MRYKLVCVAGTFDGLHAGHEVILKKSFEVGEKVIIGLTSDQFVEQYKPSQPLDKPISPYKKRKQELSAWLTKTGLISRTTIVPIDNPFEPAVSDWQAGALVVSQETKKRGVELNKLREAKGLPSLKLVVVPIQKAEDGKSLSSTRIRLGEVDASGRLVMPDSLRNTLAQPLGSVLSTAKMMKDSFNTYSTGMVITVGDLTTKTLLDAGITPVLMIIDNKVERKPFTDLQPMFKKFGFKIVYVDSGPGFISQEALKEVKDLLKVKQPVVLDVTGEEDLLTLPVLAEAPIGTVVYYGQPPVPAWSCGPMIQGVVEVIVTEDKKKEIRAILKRFH